MPFVPSTQDQRGGGGALTGCFLCLLPEPTQPEAGSLALLGYESDEQRPDGLHWITDDAVRVHRS